MRSRMTNPVRHAGVTPQEVDRYFEDNRINYYLVTNNMANPPVIVPLAGRSANWVAALNQTRPQNLTPAEIT